MDISPEFAKEQKSKARGLMHDPRALFKATNVTGRQSAKMARALHGYLEAL